MSVERTREVMTEYLDALVNRGDYARYFSDDVVFRVMGTPEQARGREGVEQFIRYLHEVAFDAHPKIVRLVVEDGEAALEAEFIGTHVAEFAGVVPSGNEVNLPYSVFYTLQDDKITELRGYLALDLLVRQLSPTPEMGRTTP